MPTSRGRRGYRSGLPEERAEDLHELVADDRVGAVVATIGGLNTIELLPYLDYDLLAEHAKPICGFSDVSVLLNAVVAQSRLVTFHGPTAMASFGEVPAPFEATVDSFVATLEGLDRPWSLPEPPEWTDELIEWTMPESDERARTRRPNCGPRWRGRHAAEGTLIGGNLDSLVNIVGTDLWPEPEHPILLLEQSAVSIDRWAMGLWALKVRGALRGVRAVLVGKPERLPEEAWTEVEDLVSEVLADDSPDAIVVSRLDVGHTEPIVTLPLGGRVRVDAGRRDVAVLPPPAEARTRPERELADDRA